MNFSYIFTDMVTYQTTKNSSINHVIIIAVTASVSVVLCTLIVSVSLLVAYIIKRRTAQGAANRSETER